MNDPGRRAAAAGRHVSCAAFPRLIAVRVIFAVFLALLCVCLPTAAWADPAPIFVWHAYRGDEQRALEALARRYEAEHGVVLDLLAVPYGAYAAKLEAAIPHGHGPDVFIDAHERLGTYARDGLAAPVGDAVGDRNLYGAASLAAVTQNGVLYGVPLSTKCLALIVNERLAPGAIPTLESLLARPFANGVYPLAYESMSAYAHAPFLHAFGGTMLDAEAHYGFGSAAAVKSVDLVASWAKAGVIPPDANSALVSQLFASERAAAVISGPWFLADLKVDFPVRVIPLPMLVAAGAAPRPFLTVEAAMLSPAGSQRADARAFARWLATDEAAISIRRDQAKQLVAARSEHKGEVSPLENGFRLAAEQAVAMPTDPRMRAAWVPTEQAIAKVLRGDATSREACSEAAARFLDATKAPPPPPTPAPLILALGVLSILGAFLAVRRARSPGFRDEVARSLPAYRYVTHSIVIVFALVVLPLLAGASTSLFAGSRQHASYVGAANYIQILTARGGPLLAHGSFYLTLLVTVVWTLINVALHLGLGVLLGVVLSRETLRFKPLYRTLLILPWAIPSYVTALAWKGMFHRQFGAVNGILTFLGAEPVSWFSKFSTAFAANITTNVWLGFPFMMVVTMGALTSISKDVLEAAEVDGATRWQRFWLVTFPLLRPVLLPSVALGAVWTFNMFNVVFLVSGGEPDGTTDILVSDAYRWAFTRDAQVGYAAAYAVIIFMLLFLGSRVAARFGRREGEAS